MTPRLIIFDDDLGQLSPMTDLRAAFEVRTGMQLTCGRIAAAWPGMVAGYWAPQRLAKLVAERASVPVNVLPADDLLLCVNGRWPMPDASLQLSPGEALVEQDSGHVVAAMLSRSDAERFLRSFELPDRVRAQPLPQQVLYRCPWDVIAQMKRTIPHDIALCRILDARIASDAAAVVGDHPIDVHASARIYPNVTFDAEGGPIMVHERAVIRPGAVLVGPCSIGADSTVIDRALIKANTVIGPHCKVAGEVGGTIFQGYANKAHDGHLGDSWVGKWVNFGAGTTNSNLLNTYGEVVMRLEEGQRRRTGLQFLGAIIGDHAKFAINTRIMTGSVIGTGAMIATTAPSPTTVPRFAWMTDEAATQTSKTFRLQKFLEIAKTVMARRNVTPSEAYISALRELHARSGREAQSR